MIQFGAHEYIPSPRIDLVFKSIFSQNVPESRGALKDFLESIIGRKVTEVSVQGNELAARHVTDKQAVMDLNCMFNDGDQANVEIQLNRRGNMVPRSEYYLCKLHSGQAVKSQKYDELHYTYQITILDYPLLADELPFLNEYAFRDCTGRALEGIRTQMYFLELTKLRVLLERPTEDLTRPEKWALFFKYADDEKKREKINEIICKEEGLEMASKMLEQLAKDSAMRVTLLSMEKAESDRYNELIDAEERGMEKGMERGMERGMEKGVEKGRQELIRSMAAEGIPFDLIARTSRISVDEVKKILQ